MRKLIQFFILIFIAISLYYLSKNSTKQPSTNALTTQNALSFPGEKTWESIKKEMILNGSTYGNSNCYNRYNDTDTFYNCMINILQNKFATAQDFFEYWMSVRKTPLDIIRENYPKEYYNCCFSGKTNEYCFDDTECSNGGKCVDFVCACNKGWSSTTKCQQQCSADSECGGIERGSCVNGSCICTKDYIGPNCETSVPPTDIECNKSIDCASNPICAGKVIGTTCKCLNKKCRAL